MRIWPATVVAAQGGNDRELVIRPEDVEPGGTYRLRTTVTGRLAGGWNALVSVTVPETEPADRFALVLEGEPVGYVRSVTGGTISGGATSGEPVTVEVDLGLRRPLYDWIHASFSEGQVSRNGSIVGCDPAGREREVHEFRNATIESVSFPSLAPEDTSPAYLTITFAPEAMRREKGSGRPSGVDTQPATKKWLASNFRFELGGLPVDPVSRIDAFTWKPQTSELKLTVSTTDLASWDQWHRTFDGRASDRLDGRLVFLGTDVGDELATLELRDTSMASLALKRDATPAGGSHRFTLELIDSEMSFVH
jgi:hypothetical protein